MSTWFEKERGFGSGRISPRNNDAPDGDNVFVLGNESAIEEGKFSVGDWTSIKQVIDLTEYDFVNATSTTIGRETQSILEDLALWTDDDSEIMRFELSESGSSCQNSVSGGFALNDSANITHGIEEYSGANKVCRIVSAGSSDPSNLNGVNTPPISPGSSQSLSKMTLQFWSNIRWDLIGVTGSIPFIEIGDTSGGTGFSINVFRDGLGNCTFIGDGSAGVGNMSNVFVRTDDVGWEMITIVYDSELPLTDGAWKIYSNGVLLGNIDNAIAGDPVLPASGEVIRIGNYRIPSGIGPIRILDRAVVPIEVTSEHSISVRGTVNRECKWMQQILINNVLFAEREIVFGENRVWTDFKVPVRKLSGNHEVEFRLYLKEV